MTVTPRKYYYITIEGRERVCWITSHAAFPHVEVELLDGRRLAADDNDLSPISTEDLP